MEPPVLALDDFHVRFRTHQGVLHAVKGISLSVYRGETLAIVGESGSGKSQTMLAALKLLAANGEVSGSARLLGQDLTAMDETELNRLRGARVTMIFQEPMTSLDPLYTIGAQLIAVLRKHQRMSRRSAREKAIALLARMRIPDPDMRIDSYPHELSGGQRQRVMIAMALANNPDLLIADEPTTALDVTVQAEILMLLADLQREMGMAMVFITHDLGIVKRIATRVAVMRHGEIVETGAVADVFSAPQHAYTRALIDAEPSGTKVPHAADAPPILEIEKVNITYTLKKGWFGRQDRVIRAVDGVSLRLHKGETIGIVGESGSGKSTLGKAVVKLAPASGMIRMEDRALLPLTREGMRPHRRALQMVFQDPYGSLSPRMTAGEIVSEGLIVHEPHLRASERDRLAAKALEDVQLDPALRNRFPHEFSGGQRQRIAIARAMILKPKIVILDEPTSALDRSIQKAIVDLLRDLQAKYSLSYLFISHDLAVVRAMADTLLVMKDGKIVEQGAIADIITAPRESYTRSLLAAAGHTLTT